MGWKEIKNMYCLRCGMEYAAGDFFKGCPRCLAEGKPASVSFQYHPSGLHQAPSDELLPYNDRPYAGEGQTPHIYHSSLSDTYKVEIWFKNEGQNPTGSHKDRMSPYIVQRAIEAGFTTVASASSGNAGASLAAYAAMAGMKGVILTTRGINPIWKQAIEKTEATIIWKDYPMERWAHMKEEVEKGNWYPATNFMNPPVGSNPFGVQGLKSIAFEIIEDMEKLPGVIVIPTSRGDLLWGIWEGFKQAYDRQVISELPRLLAVEPFARLQAVRHGASYIGNFEGNAAETPSVAGTTVTYQSVKALQESGGEAVVVPTERAEAEQQELAEAGIYAERSSSLVLGALKQARRTGMVQEGEKVLLLLSSNGYKELLV
ncbi:threonine synthase [Salibacterium aidingense]|uniref:threonine synthase n=1 Tax=Salibacterium aidingense TaxID=384933 RepID=UPI00041108A0|nr:pyridoxal-phosphate dependent enzyme [Salibacterium aidingense]